MRSVSLIFLLLSSIVARATTITVDFEEAGFPNFSTGSNVVSRGFEFTHHLDGVSPEYWPYDYGSDSAGGLFYCPGCVATMEHTEGKIFSLHALDLSNISAFVEDRSITFTGYFASGGSISTELTATTDETNWTNYTFSSDWQNLVSLEFGALYPPAIYTAIGFDNVVVTVVPIPAAVWLFGSALAGLGWFRRRQTA
jgi:hypothetical protein